VAALIGGVARGFLAMLAGFVAIAVPVVLITGALQSRVPQWVGKEGHPRPAYVAVNLCYSFLFSVAGGLVTAWIARDNPLGTVLALAIVILVLGALSALQSKDRQPLRYRIALLVVSPVGVVAGGIFRVKLSGSF
jgi:DMSO reductase anchor subunit